MSNFEFGHKVTINGKEYTLNSDLDEVRRVMKDTGDKITKLDKPNDKRKLFSLTRKAVDTALGKGSYDEITEGKTITAYDIIDLIGFIGQEIMKVQQIRADIEVSMRTRNLQKK